VPRRPAPFVACLFAVLAMAAPGRARAQQSLSPTAPSGQTVNPVFEGWYRNADGSFSLSFGYFNRNTSEVVAIPVGSDNFIAPGDANQGQPAYFYPRRHWGVFAVRVPADFGEKKVVWTVKVRGKTFAIPGSLAPDWQVDALEGEAGSGNTPPGLTLDAGGPEARGPAGLTAAPRSATVGKPLTIKVVARDDGKKAGTARTGAPVALDWFTHQGPAAAVFGTPAARLTPTGGEASTTVTFASPGDYVLRVRATDAPLPVSGHSQCCWTNAFVNVRVVP
jgi:hypothetical protein